MLEWARLVGSGLQWPRRAEGAWAGLAWAGYLAVPAGS